MDAKRAIKKKEITLNPLVKTLLEEIKARGSKVPAFATNSGIPKERIYKWKQEGTSPKEDDAKIIRIWLATNKFPPKKEIPPHGQFQHQEEISKFSELVIEKLTQLEANIRVLNSMVTNIKHRVTGESETKISLELEKTSHEVADMIFDELQKKFSDRI